MRNVELSLPAEIQGEKGNNNYYSECFASHIICKIERN